MHTRHIITFVAFFSMLHSALGGPVLLDETFSGSNLSSTNWTSFVPYSDSSVSVGSGALTLTNGGGVLSNADYQTPIEVLFSFAFTGNTHDSFRVYTRVDDFRSTGYHVAHGIGVSFRIQEDTGNLLGNVALEDSSGVLTTGTFALTANTYYTGRLLDTGSGFGFYWGADINPFLTATSSEHYGDGIAAWNRHGAGAGSYISAGSQMSLDYLTVLDLDNTTPENVPDDGVTVIYAALGMFGLVAVRKRQRIAS